MAYLTRRRLAPEHMDDPHADAAELAAALRFLRRVNRRLAGIAPVRRVLARWMDDLPRDHTVRVLDVGTGSADLPLALAQWAPRRGRRIRITAVDVHETTLDLARRYVGNRDDIELVQADARMLMDRFEPGSFDFAHAGLFLHHLHDLDVMTVLRIMYRLAPRGVIWNDLLRNTAARAGVRLLSIGAPPMVRHDGIVSVEAGFTPREALDLAHRVGLPNVRLHRHLLYRFTLTAAP